STQTQNVIIDDVTAPTPDVAVLADVTAECEVTSLTAPTATDNCSNATITVTNDAMLPISGEGTTTVVTWSYNDGNGNISTQTQNVIIDDVTAPTPDVAVLADVTAECEITSLTAPTATDNCSNATVTVTSDAMLPITAQGTTVVTWSYDDGNGNISTQTQNVILDDVTAPVVDAATLPDLVFNCVVTSLTPPTATDNCVGTVTGTATFPINTTRVVMWSFDDGNGNVTTQSQLVIIERRAIDAIANVTACDTFTLPTITGDYLTGSQQYYTQPGGNGTAFAEATTLNFADFASYPVTLYAYDTDGAGCSAERSFTLTINATPVIAPIAAVTACDQYVLPALPVGNYFTFPGGNGNMVAAGTVITATQTLFVYATNGSCTDQESFTVNIQPLDNPAFNYSAATYCPNGTDPTPTVTGLAGGTFTSTTGLAINATTGVIDLDASILGSYVVTYTTNGNCPQSSTVNVTIEDNDAPVPTLAVLAAVTAQCEVTSLVAPTATDNCGGTVTVTSDAIFPITGEGTTTVVTWTYTDANGNTATQTQNVVIDDTTAPVATMAALPSLTFNCDVSSLTAPTATDNCVGTITATTSATFPINATRTVTWTYDDGNGNVSTQTQLIVIERLAINAIANATQCDTFTLPTITGNFLTGAQQYYTQPGGNGTAFAEGTTLNFADFASYPVTLYAYDANSAGCSAQVAFQLTINNSPVVAPIADVTICDQYVLPALPVGNYFTFPGGNGTLISAGSVITASQTLFVYAQDPSGDCSDEESFVINITPSDITGATFDNANFTFNGTAQSIFVQNIPSTATVVYTNNGQTNAGTYVVTATITSANATCNTVTRTATMTIGRAEQTITFDPLMRRRLFVDPDFQINASASSGLPLTYTFSFTGASPAATVSATGFVTLLDQGEILITASQPGNGNFLPAQQVQRRLEVYLGDNADLDAITISGDVINNPDSEIYYLIDCDDSADFVDVELTNNDSATFNPGATFTINTPRPGIYRQQVIVTAENGMVTRTYNITVERRFQFDAIVEQKYNNVLVVNNNPANNGGYSFVAYEWFKNDRRVGTQQFFSEGDNATDVLDPTALYYVRMTTTTGEVLQTCVSTISLGNTFSLTVLENPVISGRKLNVRADYPTSELDNARYELYSASGQYLYTVRVDGVDTAIELSESLPVGMYRLVLITQARSQSVNFIKN
ncbi:MAG: hypothetical protein NWQ09_03460, partial [Nonlabens sp.]|nr:hypothetical protein [Nonlabens sp.]